MKIYHVEIICSFVVSVRKLCSSSKSFGELTSPFSEKKSVLSTEKISTVL